MRDDTQMDTSPTHYEVLSVAETATHAQIKAAHRALVLQCHPDKQIDHHTTAEDEPESFLQIQRAWECLRDPKTREEYNQMLQRTRDKNRAQAALFSSSFSSSVVSLSQMNTDICQVFVDKNEHYDESTASIQTTLFTYPCRCGDEFQVLEQDFNSIDASTDDDTQVEWTKVFSCPSCSLSIQVVKDI